jgi:predicted DNA-binding protein
MSRLGRPPLPVGLRRDGQTRIRLSKAERAQLDELAELEGMTVSDLVRHLVAARLRLQKGSDG